MVMMNELPIAKLEEMAKPRPMYLRERLERRTSTVLLLFALKRALRTCLQPSVASGLKGITTKARKGYSKSVQDVIQMLIARLMVAE